MPIYKMEGKKDGFQKYRVRINYIDRNGKSKQLDRVAYGRDAAKELEIKLSQELKSGEATTSHMTVQQLFDEFIEVKQHEVREATLQTKKGIYERYVLPFVANIKISKLSNQNIQKWKQSLENYTTSKGNHLKIDTKKTAFKAFNTLLNYAVTMEYIPRNPLTAVGNFKDAYQLKQEMNYYTSDEFKLYINAAYSRAQKNANDINDWNYYTFFCIAFYTGMRKGEIYALRWSDITDNIIHVRRSISQKLKGDDRETPPKNLSSIRDLQMPKPLIDVLNEHRERCKKIDEFNDDWRICGGTTCLRDSTLQARNEAYAKAAGVKHIRVHDFRHSHASLLANAGINIQEIARRLGHSNVEITWNTYSHLYPKEEERAVNVLNNVKIM